MQNIMLTGDTEKDVDTALNALSLANTPPVIFVSRGRLVRLLDHVEELTQETLVIELTCVACFFRVESTGPVLVTPRHLAEAILRLDSWPFPPLIEKGTSSLGQQDYSLLPVVVHPTSEELASARDEVWRFFSGFSYRSSVDQANALGVLLSIVSRRFYTLSPLVLVDGDMVGCGKTFFVQALAQVALGLPLYATPVPSHNWDGVLTDHLLSGADYLFFDDVQRLQSASLAAFLTSEQFQCRFPDVTTIQRLPQRTLTIASGNHITVDDDLLRRSIRIRLTGDSFSSGLQAARPSLEMIRQHREEILQALLTLVRGWCEAGQPIPANLPNMGSFNGWAKTVGGILSVAGVDHFLGNKTIEQ